MYIYCLWLMTHRRCLFSDWFKWLQRCAPLADRLMDDKTWWPHDSCSNAGCQWGHNHLILLCDQGLVSRSSFSFRLEHASQSTCKQTCTRCMLNMKALTRKKNALCKEDDISGPTKECNPKSLGYSLRLGNGWLNVLKSKKTIAMIFLLL